MLDLEFFRSNHDSKKTPRNPLGQGKNFCIMNTQEISLFPRVKSYVLSFNPEFEFFTETRFILNTFFLSIIISLDFTHNHDTSCIKS